MKAIFIILTLLLGVLPLQADERADAIKKLLSLPAPNQKAWGDNAAKHPNGNDNLLGVILTDRGAYLSADYKKPPIPFDQLIVVLAALPKEAWPFGRLIAFWPFPPGLHSATIGEPSAENVKKVEADLKAAGIESVPGMSA